MPPKYNDFEQREMSDGEYWIAKSNKKNFDDIRLETGWFDAEPGEKGKWEKVVGAIIQNDLTGEMQLEKGEGSISREEAVANLSDSTNGDSFAENEAHAHALLDFFAIKEKAITLEDGNVVILTDPNELADEDSDTTGNTKYRILSWAAAIDACIDRMEETLTEFEEAKDRLQGRTNEVKQETSEAERKKQERAQELQALGPGSGIPNPDELSSEKRQRYEDLKEDFIYYKKLHEVEADNIGAVENGIDQLVRNIDRLEAAQETYDNKLSQVREWALSKQVFPEEAMDLAMNMGDMITAMSNTSSVSEAVDNMDHEELEGEVTDALDSAEDIAEAANKTVDEEELSESSDTMMLDQE